MNVSIEAIWVTLFLVTITGLVWSAFDHGFSIPTSKDVKH